MIRPTLFAAGVALALFTSIAPAQATASVTLYGAGCRNFQNTANAPVMTVTGTPQLGNSITIRYTGPNGSGFWTDSVPVLITGLSQVALPVPRLTVNMSASCTLLVNPDIAVFIMPVVFPAYADRWTYMIPNTPAVIGGDLFHQWATLQFNTLGSTTLDYIMFSNGVKIHAGL